MAEGGASGETQGIGLIRTGVDLVLWMQGRRNTTAEDVRRRYGVSRATAYRWLASVHQAMAVESRDSDHGPAAVSPAPTLETANA